MHSSSSNFNGKLETQVVRTQKPHKAKVLRIPKVGRVILTRDQGESNILSSEVFSSNVAAVHRRGGEIVNAYDLGSGLVTNVGVLSLANDFAWANVSPAMQTLKNANLHATGTGGTAAAATDISIQTISTQGGQTPVTGAQTLVSAANSQIYKTVATIAYTGAEAVTEWGLFTNATLTASTGSPFTSGTATSGTVTGTPLTASTASIQGSEQFIFHNTGNATPSWGLVTSNTTSVVTVPAWYKVSDGTVGATPANTNVYTIRPVMWDHKQFAAINVVSGDSIQFSYSLTINSGG